MSDQWFAEYAAGAFLADLGIDEAALDGYAAGYTAAASDAAERVDRARWEGYCEGLGDANEAEHAAAVAAFGRPIGPAPCLTTLTRPRPVRRRGSR